MKQNRLLLFSALFLLAFTSFSQKLKAIEPGNNTVPSIMAMSLEKPILPAFDYNFLEKANNLNYSKNVSVLAPHQHNLTRYPFGNVGDMNKMILGSTYVTSTTLGRKKLTGTYVFDVMGDLVDYQLTISKSKK